MLGTLINEIPAKMRKADEIYTVSHGSLQSNPFLTTVSAHTHTTCAGVNPQLRLVFLAGQAARICCFPTGKLWVCLLLAHYYRGVGVGVCSPYFSTTNSRYVSFSAVQKLFRHAPLIWQVQCRNFYHVIHTDVCTKPNDNGTVLAK